MPTETKRDRAFLLNAQPTMTAISGWHKNHDSYIRVTKNKQTKNNPATNSRNKKKKKLKAQHAGTTEVAKTTSWKEQGDTKTMTVISGWQKNKNKNKKQQQTVAIKRSLKKHNMQAQLRLQKRRHEKQVNKTKPNKQNNDKTD